MIKPQPEVLLKLEEIQLRPVAAKHYRDVLELKMSLGRDRWSSDKGTQHWTSEKLTPRQRLKSGWMPGALVQNSFGPTGVSALKQMYPLGSMLNLQSIINATSGKTVSWVMLNSLTVFAKADCAKCHRFGANGDSSGPDP
ncbi:MAG: hypothetical protein R3C03_16265 [Pirellulaceae bacterium]